MSGEKKGVTVVVSGSSSQHYERGTDIRVQDGHLYVTEGSAMSAASRIVAVYSPGHWIRARVTV